MKRVRIGNRWVGEGEPCFIIAEAGSNHGGKIEQALQLIDVAVEAGADAVKFQIYSADTLYSENTPAFSIIQSIETPRAWLSQLFGYAQKKGINHFDFLGAGSPERDYGVREFKARFGGDNVGHGRYLRINHRFLFELGKLGLKMAGGMKRI